MNLCYVIWSNTRWMSVNFNFVQLLLNLTHCAAPQTGIEPRYPGPDSTISRTVCPQQSGTQMSYLQTDPRDSKNTLTLSGVGRN